MEASLWTSGHFERNLCILESQVLYSLISLSWMRTSKYSPMAAFIPRSSKNFGNSSSKRSSRSEYTYESWPGSVSTKINMQQIKNLLAARPNRREHVSCCPQHEKHKRPWPIWTAQYPSCAQVDISPSIQEWKNMPQPHMARSNVLHTNWTDCRVQVRC